MNSLLTIRMQDIQPDYVEDPGAQYHERRAARAVLYDEHQRVALLFSREREYYKLPGGGVDDGESMELALARELMEEVGTEAEVYGEIGRIEEWRDTERGMMHQISDAYLARVNGEVGRPSFTESEIADGFEVHWADNIDDAIRLVSTTLNHEAQVVRFMSLREKTILEAAKSLEEA